jgi:hypothetical protein
MSYTGENVARITQAWVASANEGEPKPVCIVLDTAVSPDNMIVDLYIENGVLVGAKVYSAPRSPAGIMAVGKVPS